MTNYELQALLPRQAILADSSYAQPTLAWLQGAFWQSFKADRWAKVGSYTRKNDCDNWARAYAQHAEDCHAMSKGSDAEGLAVGEFFYTKDSGDGHAIVIAVIDDQVVFIEPQNGLTLQLTEAEILSCAFVRF